MVSCSYIIQIIREVLQVKTNVSVFLSQNNLKVINKERISSNKYFVCLLHILIVMQEIQTLDEFGHQSCIALRTY